MRWRNFEGALSALIVGTLCLIALVRRWSGLAPNGLWSDDAWVATGAKYVSLDNIAYAGFTHPGFTVIIRGAQTLSIDTWALQLVPFTVALALIPTTFAVARRLGARPATSSLSAVLIAHGPVLETYSLRVKQYSLDALVGLLLVALLATWLSGGAVPSVRRAAAASALMILGFVVSGGTAVASAGLLGAMAIWLLVEGRRSWVQLLLPAAGLLSGLAAFAGWYLVHLRSVTGSEHLRQFWSDRFVDASSPSTFTRTLVENLHDAIDGATALPRPVDAALFWFAALVLGAGRRRCLLLLAPIGALTAASTLKIAPLGGGRTDAMFFGALVLAVALSFDEVAARLPTLGGTEGVRHLALFCLPVVALLAGLASLGERPTYPARANRSAEGTGPEKRCLGECCRLRHSNQQELLVCRRSDRWY